jgi:hypothetical protein
VLLRAAGVCGLLALVTSSVGWIVGGLAQPDAFSSANDDISDLGAETASSPWLYNQIGSNLTGFFVIALAVGLWVAIRPGILGRLGLGAVLVAGLGIFLDGFFRLDCQGLDAGCANDSWHSDAHRWESRFTAAGIVLSPLLLAFALRSIPAWRDAWLPSAAVIPVSFLVGAGFSTVGDGAATRADAVIWFLWIAYLGVRLIQKSETGRVRTEV